MSPVMEEVVEFAERGGYVIGICNGFQVLCEAHLLPGVLMPNASLQFRCQETHLRVDNADTAFTTETEKGQILRVPISHGEGNYFADQETLDSLEREGRVVFRFTTADGEVTDEANPNGSLNNIAGIINENGNVLGMMPHPERSSETLLGSEDGLAIFKSIVKNSERVFSH
jgi:phosphoribosylformylglycinamidine synthase